MGKYTNIASHFAPKPEEGSYQAEVAAVKRTITNFEAADLAKRIVEIRAEKSAAKDCLDEINLRLNAHEQVLTDTFEESGITQVRLETGETISTQIKPYARVVDRLAFRQWCVEAGFEEALALPWPTTNSLVADRLLDGLPEPAGIETFKQTTVVLRRGRG